MDEGNTQVREGLARWLEMLWKKIILGAQWSANVANDIANAIQEQTTMNQSIETSIQDVVYVATENTQATKEQEVGAARDGSCRKMTSLADQVHRATIEQTKGAAEVINATEEMSALVHSSVKNTQQLLQATQDFMQTGRSVRRCSDSHIETDLFSCSSKGRSQIFPRENLIILLIIFEFSQLLLFNKHAHLSYSIMQMIPVTKTRFLQTSECQSSAFAAKAELWHSEFVENFTALPLAGGFEGDSA